MSDEMNAAAAEIRVTDEDGTEIVLYVLEETRINGMDYLLAADAAEGDGDVYILKDVSKSEEAEAVYRFVDNDDEAEYVFRIFQELMKDEDIDLVN